MKAKKRRSLCHCLECDRMFDDELQSIFCPHVTFDDLNKRWPPQPGRFVESPTPRKTKKGRSRK